MNRWLSGLGLVILLVGFCGCASTEESDDVSARPWNQPRHWESGLPTGMYEGR
jgi:hypothetical protein